MSRTCPVCDGATLEQFLVRRNVPVHQNLLFRTAERARAIARGDLEMTLCVRCDFVFNAAFDGSKLQYGEDYENDQTASPVFDAYVTEIVRMLVEEKGVRNANVVEVGCGNGYFLRRLVDASENRGVGFDPSYTGPGTDLGGRLTFIREFYSSASTTVRPDVVVSRHVVEHVPEPGPLVEGIREAIGSNGGVKLFLETPCVEWILRNRVIWDFFFEHCSLFSPRSLAALARRGGFNVDAVNHVFGGQYLWLEGTSGSERPGVEGEGTLAPLARAFAAEERSQLEAWTKRVSDLASRGPLAIWGAGAKGVTFAGLVDADAEIVDCLIDINPQKQGKFVPGTAHPIVDFHEAARRGVRRAVLMNPNYYDETASLLRQAGVTIELMV